MGPESLHQSSSDDFPFPLLFDLFWTNKGLETVKESCWLNVRSFRHVGGRDHHPSVPGHDLASAADQVKFSSPSSSSVALYSLRVFLEPTHGNPQKTLAWRIRDRGHHRLTFLSQFNLSKLTQILNTRTLTICFIYVHGPTLRALLSYGGEFVWMRVWYENMSMQWKWSYQTPFWKHKITWLAALVQLLGEWNAGNRLKNRCRNVKET